MSSPVESSKKAREASAPSNTADGEVLAKVEHPHEHFEHPADVVMDPLLSKPEKAQVLDALEQDARQLSMAADEGMPSGGGSGLQNVLVAKESLELPPFALAMSVCLQSLKGKPSSPTHTRSSPARSRPSRPLTPRLSRTRLRIDRGDSKAIVKVGHG